ncbi:uncharacterized protein LOC129946125 isoform X2 [Eupeodes corollae]|uniref:uncharacterized protein LOC129946125 isoform X2 n=1 Tax=Eupeodes corollae TaxID=290404 RepID=UPI002493AF9B|nr:uncharacterized protein LOC129946125 isoform X2 [Eupeodes corollae]
MELPLQTPVDIYQIHRTPYFKRIHRNDSDQFERLKKAYESIRNFDEKPLQAQINKVRLEKLVQRINKSIPKTKLGPENRLNRPRPKSNDEIRCEKIVKSRQMGIEYSRQNFNSTTRLIKPKYVDPKEDLVKKKLKLNRRLDYGNKKSEINRSKIQRSQGFILSEAKEFGTFSSEAPTSEKLQKQKIIYIGI